MTTIFKWKVSHTPETLDLEFKRNFIVYDTILLHIQHLVSSLFQVRLERLSWCTRGYLLMNLRIRLMVLPTVD